MVPFWYMVLEGKTVVLRMKPSSKYVMLVNGEAIA